MRSVSTSAGETGWEDTPGPPVEERVSSDWEVTAPSVRLIGVAERVAQTEGA
jgi:hypothetical protein